MSSPEYHREWYERNKARQKALSQARRAEIRRIIAEAKDEPCADCQNEYPSYVMDFDHVTGEKLFDIGQAPALNMPLKRLLEEIAKCDVVCSNCHRERTHGTA